MSGNLSIASTTPSILSCPKCNETIDVSSEKCRFCGEPINADFARHAADVLARVNQAVSEASYMRTTALALPVFFVLRFIPFLSMLGGVGWTGLLLIVPVWAIRWWLRYSSIETSDDDFIRSRKAVKIVGLVVGSLAVLSVLFLVGVFVVSFMAAIARH